MERREGTQHTVADQPTPEIFYTLSTQHISADLVRSEPGRRRTRKDPCREKSPSQISHPRAPPHGVASLQSPYPVRTRGGGGVPDLGFPQMEEGKAGGWAGAGERGVLLTVGAPNGGHRLYVVRCRLLVLVAGARTGDVVVEGGEGCPTGWREGTMSLVACLQGQSGLWGFFG